MLIEKRKREFSNGTVYALLTEDGYDYAVAIATEAEINAKATCGQLSIITEDEV